MSEIIIRNAIEYTKEKATIMKLGRENEALNRGLEAMRLSNAVLTKENEALRKELNEARARAKDARARNRAIYDARIREMADARADGPAKRWQAVVLVLFGMLIMAAVILFIFRPEI